MLPRAARCDARAPRGSEGSALRHRLLDLREQVVEVIARTRRRDVLAGIRNERIARIDHRLHVAVADRRLDARDLGLRPRAQLLERCDLRGAWLSRVTVC